MTRFPTTASPEDLSRSQAGRLREAASLNEQYKKLAVTNQQKDQTVDQ